MCILIFSRDSLRLRSPPLPRHCGSARKSEIENSRQRAVLSVERGRNMGLFAGSSVMAGCASCLQECMPHGTLLVVLCAALSVHYHASECRVEKKKK